MAADALSTALLVLGVEAEVDAMVGAALLHMRAGTGWSLQGSVGLTNTSPDFSLAASWRITL